MGKLFKVVGSRWLGSDNCHYVRLKSYCPLKLAYTIACGFNESVELCIAKGRHNILCAAPFEFQQGLILKNASYNEGRERLFHVDAEE
jgi:hypothetical protein